MKDILWDLALVVWMFVFIVTFADWLGLPQ